MIDAHEASERIWLVLDSLSAAHPDMPFKDGVLLAQKVYKEVDWMREQGVSDPPLPDAGPPDPKDTEALARWLGGQRSVTDYLPDKKINGIKEARGLVPGCGLKEAKEAIEMLVENPQWISGKI